MIWKDMERKREWWAEYRPKYRPMREKQRVERIDLMLSYLGGCCAICESTDRLEFHHKDPATKAFNPRAAALKRWETLVPEMDKCELRCVSCHDYEHRSKHGSVTMYMHKKCRCEQCMSGTAEWRAMRRQKERDRKRKTVNDNKNLAVP